MNFDSLWGEEFVVEQTPQLAKSISTKIKNPKTITKKKSKTIPLDEQMKIIEENVNRILGRYKDNTVLLKTKEQLNAYIDTAIENGIIAVDTETNNSLDPLSCQLMGLCIYTPHEKNAYVPVHHVDAQGNRLEWQLSEQDIKEALDRLKNTKILMHNGKFDYQVLKCTTGSILSVYWDTLLAARLLDENEKRAGLKEQYIDKIDSSIEKYSIEHLFEGLEYALFKPELFALYAATDAYMTYRLYEWQKKQFDKVDNKKLLKLLLEVEMPVMVVAAEMELYGSELDIPYSERLSKKYHKKLEDVDRRIQTQLHEYDDLIAKWRTTEEANYRQPNGIAEDGSPKYKKSKSEQLEPPPSLTSNTQLAILLYDILKMPVVDKDSPRGTGVDILKKLAKQTSNPLCNLVLEQRGIEKLLSTYIDKLPKCINPVDGRLHAQFNQLGTETGRFSSKDPNL